MLRFPVYRGCRQMAASAHAGTARARLGAGTLPASAAAAAATASSSACGCALAEQHRWHAEMYSKTRVVTENRVSKWCRRLWKLSNQGGHIGASVSAQQAAAAVSRVAAAARSASTATDEPAAASTLPPTISTEELIEHLRSVVTGSKSRLPAVLVGAIWEVYDALLPAEVQADLAHALTAERLNGFFSFIELLTEMDFSLQEVRSAARALSHALEDCEAAIAAAGATATEKPPVAATPAAEQQTTVEGKKEEAEETPAATATAAAAAAAATETSASASPWTVTAADLDRRAALEEEVLRAKDRVSRACFSARNAGSPLYYTWLRNTAALEGGIRRLMDFRKVVHYFDVECKKRLRSLHSEQAKAAVISSNASSPTVASAAGQAATDLEVEMHFWQKRERDMGVMDRALTFLFHDFFSKEYLVMEELTWFSTPPSMLEQIIAAEGVHPFKGGLRDMHARLQPTHHRHLFAFLHPAVVEEPLIAVQVAITKGISGSVDYILGRSTPLLDPANVTAHGRAMQEHRAKYGPDRPDKELVDTAIFYSINSAQSALRGMDMGNMLIKRVVREIEENINASRQTRHLTPVTQFSTLSPIPAYMRWLSGEVEKLNNYARKATRTERRLVRTEDSDTRIFGTAPDPQELEDKYFKPVRAAVQAYVIRHNVTDEAPSMDQMTHALANGDMVLANAHALRCLVRLLLTPDAASPWWLDHYFTAVLEQPMLRSAAHYLCEQKKKKNGAIWDPVGNFHVSNGATIFRVNFLGNTTAQGSRESGCMMVNYWYNTHTISRNVEQYEMDKTVAMDVFMTDLLKNDITEKSA